MKIIYNRNEGLIVPDGKAEETARELIKANKDVVIASELIILAMRVIVKEDKISPKSLELYHEDKYLPLDKNGRLPEWPNGFCDTAEGLMFRIL